MIEGDAWIVGVLFAVTALIYFGLYHFIDWLTSSDRRPWS